MADNKRPYRWTILTLAVLVNLFAVGMSISCMPPLRDEISREIPMTNTQWGTVWGITFIPMMVCTLLAGLLADRSGCKTIVGVATIVMGVAGIGRAYAQSFYQLSFFMFLLGTGWAALMPNLPRALGHWFPSAELGLANGILIAGVCAGSGSAIMASGVYLSPLMGGWRQLMWLYGLICVALGGLWIVFFREHPVAGAEAGSTAPAVSFRKALAAVVPVRDIWLLNAARFCMFGALLSVIGFLPELLHGRGMPKNMAHLSSSLIYWVNIAGVIAIPLLSDKIRNRKLFIWPFSLVASVLILSLGFFQNAAALAVCGAIGLIVGYIPLMMAMPMEMRGIKPQYFGTALGLSLTAGNFGSFLAPIIGGKVIDMTGSAVAAFLFWGALMAAGAVFVLPMRETGGGAGSGPLLSCPLE